MLEYVDPILIISDNCVLHCVLFKQNYILDYVDPILILSDKDLRIVWKKYNFVTLKPFYAKTPTFI